MTNHTPVSLIRPTISLCCPSCQRPLVSTAGSWNCPAENVLFQTRNAIADFVLPHRRDAVDEFLEYYQQVRSKEGWGSEDNAYYCDLPYIDQTGRQRATWRARSKTFKMLLDDLQRSVGQSRLLVLDLGAGNGWMSLRFSTLGHTVVCVDVNLDPLDGLGVLSRFGNDEPHPQAIRAEFDHLPFAPGQFDVIVFNASLHYSKDPSATLSSVIPLLRTNGILYVCDSPFFEHSTDGKRMVEDSKQAFRKDLFLDLPDHVMSGFLTRKDFEKLSTAYCVKFLQPRQGTFQPLRRLWSSFWIGRAIATFEIVRISKHR